MTESRILRYAEENAHRRYELPLYPEEAQVEALEATGAWKARPRGDWYLAAIPGHYLTVPRVRAVLTALALGAALAGCVDENVRIEYVDRPVPTQVPLPAKLTALPDPVPDPPFNCLDADRRPTVCHEDAQDWQERMKKMVADLIEQIRSIAELQPKP